MYGYDIFVQGVPGKSDTHGGLGWSTITLLKKGNLNIIIDTGSFGVRKLLLQKLKDKGLTVDDITHVLLTHTHWDHSVNWMMFPNAEIFVSEIDMNWALNQPIGTQDVPELYIKELNVFPNLKLINHKDEVLPNIIALQTRGHTPGHMAFVVDNGDYQLIFAGDAIKNKAELISKNVDMTLELSESKSSIEYLWNIWKQKNDNILIPGHDISMRLINDKPTYIQTRNVNFQFWLGDSFRDTSNFSL